MINSCNKYINVKFYTTILTIFWSSEKDSCSDAVCFNNATCSATLDGAECLCTEYFDGIVCELGT